VYLHLVMGDPVIGDLMCNRPISNRRLPDKIAPHTGSPIAHAIAS